jgi:hypothetical protein
VNAAVCKKVSVCTFFPTTHLGAPTGTVFFECAGTPMFSFLTSRAGQLTPKEFVECGDRLVDASSLFLWRGASPPSLSCASLPLDKQYLYAARLTIIAASVAAAHNDGPDSFSLIDGVDDSGGDSGGSGGGGGGGGGGAGAAATAVTVSLEPAAEINMSIVWDTWWRVPHAFFSSSNVSPQRLLALCSLDMTTTATLSRHPLVEHLPACVSVHPCKTAAVLQTFDDKAQALIVFLKIVQHALPGLALDATWSV